MPFPGGTQGSHDDGQHQGSAKRNTLNGVMGLDANKIIALMGAAPAFALHLTHSSLYYTVVQGTFAWAADAGQTDFETWIGEAAGYWRQSVGPATLDEYKFPLNLEKGRYNLTIAYYKGPARGIVEVLTDSTSLGTVDTYAAGGAANQIATFPFTLSASVTDLRIRVNGKNVGSANYYFDISRILLEKYGV
jgi:hypothetical protein